MHDIGKRSSCPWEYEKKNLKPVPAKAGIENQFGSPHHYRLVCPSYVLYKCTLVLQVRRKCGDCEMKTMKIKGTDNARVRHQ